MLWLLAVSLLALASGLTPEQVDAKKWLKDGDKLLAQERPSKAAAAYREAIRLDPLLMMAHYGLGQAQMDLKQYPAAIEAFRGAEDAFHKRLAAGLRRPARERQGAATSASARCGTASATTAEARARRTRS